MKQHLKWVSAVSLLALILVSTIFTVPVSAAAPVINDVNPKQILNNADTAITISGSGFGLQAEVYVGSKKVEVTYFSDIQLIARVPAGLEAGTYSVTVTNPGTPAESAVWLTGSLTLVAPTPTAPPAVSGRPQVVIDTYSISVSAVRYNQDFDFNVSLDNAGGSTALGLQVTFTSTTLIMLNNGGVSAAGDLGVVGKAGISQRMTAAAPLVGLNRVSVDMAVTYQDDKGVSYADKFTLYFTAIPSATGGSTAPTPNNSERAQLVIKNYQTDVNPLQPGYEFSLSISVQNVGNLTARNVTMIVGGGSASGSSGGTQQPGGINGGSGEFSTFAPVGTSNLQSLGDFKPGTMLTAKQDLIVNVSANPGAYPFKLSFSYVDGNGNQINDDQVITLLVFSLPDVEVSFYQPVSDFMVGQMSPLPLQVTSLGKRTAVLGKMKVEAGGAQVTNGEALIGSLDPGGYFTLDSMFMPEVAGPQDLNITIEYTDDFNQSQKIVKTLSINVIDAPAMPTPDPNNPGGGVDVPVTTETTWQKIWRFIRGLFGLDSAPASPNVPAPTEVPVPFPPIKGGGKG